MNGKVKEVNYSNENGHDYRSHKHESENSTDLKFVIAEMVCDEADNSHKKIFVFPGRFIVFHGSGCLMVHNEIGGFHFFDHVAQM